MKDFCLGFLAATCLCLIGFMAWEYVRFVPVVVKPVPVPVYSSPVPELSPVITE